MLNKIYGCFDIETNNCPESPELSFPVSYQLSTLKDCKTKIIEIDKDNYEEYLEYNFYRHYTDIYNKFDEIIEEGVNNNFVPIILVHNLSFEIAVLGKYMNNFEIVPICKSRTNPILISLKRDGVELIKFWDTCSMENKSLESIGEDCGIEKLVGYWDYNKFRDNKYEFTEEELEYAKRDTIIPFVYISYFLRINPDIDESLLGTKIITQTGIVRYKRNKNLKDIKFPDGKNIMENYYTHTMSQKPKSDDELFTMYSANRGGAQYCAFNNVSKVFHKDSKHNIFLFDATSMHPFHGIAHEVPVDYKYCEPQEIYKAAENISKIDYIEVMENYANPFGVFFYAPITFYNVRLKEGSIFERDGITTFSKSRFVKTDYSPERVNSNEGGLVLREHMKDIGYYDKCSDDAEFAFSKLVRCDWCRLMMSEQSFWEFCQMFDFDYFDTESGYITNKSRRNHIAQMITFNMFYKDKETFKNLMEKYNNNDKINSDDVPDNIPENIKEILFTNNKEKKHEIKYYYGKLKQLLNSVYGMEVMMENKPKIKYKEDGFYIESTGGVDTLPKKPRTWYQYGNHIAGWSRIHQILFMKLLEEDVDAFICGDTDSHKIYTTKSLEEIESKLSILHYYSDMAIDYCTDNLREYYDFAPMDGVGHYICENDVDGLYSAFNKGYIYIVNGEIDMVAAGMPTRIYLEIANDMLVNGASFDEICETLMSYNTYVDSDITGILDRVTPEWCSMNKYYDEPNAVTLIPTSFTIGSNEGNKRFNDIKYSVKNNPNLRHQRVDVTWDRENGTYNIEKTPDVDITKYYIEE